MRVLNSCNSIFTISLLLVTTFMVGCATTHSSRFGASLPVHTNAMGFSGYYMLDVEITRSQKDPDVAMCMYTVSDLLLRTFITQNQCQVTKGKRTMLERTHQVGDKKLKETMSLIFDATCITYDYNLFENDQLVMWVKNKSYF